MDLAVMCLMYVAEIGLVILIGGLAYELLCGCTRFSEPRPKSQGGRYLIAYSYSKEVRGGQTVSGDGNYVTDKEVTDLASLKILTDEIAKDRGIANVVVLNIMAL